MGLKYSNGDTAVPVFTAPNGNLFIVQIRPNAWQCYTTRFVSEGANDCGFLATVPQGDPYATQAKAKQAMDSVAMGLPMPSAAASR